MKAKHRTGRGPEISLEEMQRRATMPKPHWQKEPTLYWQWRKARLALGLPTRTVTQAQMIKDRKAKRKARAA